jgi:predicted lipoprotein with Yx(FWY)xxD motif
MDQAFGVLAIATAFTASAAMSATGGATVKVAKSKLGAILVDSRGMTLGAPWWVLSPTKEIHRG